MLTVGCGITIERRPRRSGPVVTREAREAREPRLPRRIMVCDKYPAYKCPGGGWDED